MGRLLNQKPHGSSLDISVLACSKGAEVYSILWTIRSARPDLRLRTHAIDISREILAFAEKGVYLRSSSLDVSDAPNQAGIPERGNVTLNTWKDQNAPIFERMADEEVGAMFEVEGDQARVRSWLKEGITWICGDASDPALKVS